MGVQLMRRVIQKKAKFDIMDINCLQVAPKTFIPALFGHATGDIFIQPHHSDRIFDSYAGDKNIIKFEGDHNSHRPQFYYDSVSIFFYNVLQPPQFSSARSSILDIFCHLGNLGASAGTDERLREIITDVASSSSAPPCSSYVSATKSMGELLSEPVDFSDLVDEGNGQNEKCCSSSSSSRESWGRCSPLGRVSDELLSPADFTRTASNRHQNGQMSLRALVTPLRNIRRKLKDPPKEKMKSKKVKRILPILKKPMRGNLVNLDMLSQRFRLCVLRHVKRR